MKRNLICYRLRDEAAGVVVYGRTMRQIATNEWLVVDCGRFLSIVHEDDIVLVKDYQGFESNGRFYRMPSLRRLKQMVARYDKSVWRHRKSKAATDHHAIVRLPK